MQKYLVALGVMAFLFVLPMVSIAADLVPECGGEGQPACQACYAVELVNNVVSWLVMILGVIAAILIVVAGARLVTSGGNASAKEQAKSSMTNLIIGYIIVLSAWLVMDYGLRALLVEGGDARFGVWNSISCVAQPVSNTVEVTQQQVSYIPIDATIGNLPGWTFVGGGTPGGTGGGGSDSGQAGGGTQGTWTAPCTAVPAGPTGQTTYSCVTQQTQCTNNGGNPAVNAARNAVTCTPTQVVSGGGSGSCQVVTNPANACHPSRLTCFPDRNLASEICNVESQGGRTDAPSRTDLCQDGNSFSFGLWQINILANRNLIPGCSASFFTSSNGRDQGSCIQYRTNSGGIRYCQYRSCRITNVAVYNQCIRNAIVPANNTTAACSLMRTQGWSAWQTSYNRCR
ncbi:pilin [Patescibacteria group bacterium]|nr:pilin [Patescibacteria group bacterium]